MPFGQAAFSWDDVESYERMLATLGRDLHRLEHEAARKANTAAETIAHAYSWAGRDDSEANAQAAKTLRIANGIVERMGEIKRLLAGMKAEAVKAKGAIDESRARSTHQAASGPTLGVPDAAPSQRSSTAGATARAVGQLAKGEW